MQAGVITAYGEARQGGYTGTYEEWCEYLANLSQSVQMAQTAASNAYQYAQNASGYADSAEGSAQEAEEIVASLDFSALTTAEIDALIGGE